MNKSLRVCLIGRGSIGTRHVKNLKSLVRADILAFSPNPDPKKDAEYRVCCGVPTVHSFETVRDFRPDAFIIANPTARHREYAEAAASMHSHIFMEKPLSHSLNGIMRLKKNVESKKLVFCLANNFRFHPAFIRIRRLIEDGAFGKIYFARIMAGQYLPDWHPGEDYRKSYSARKELGGGAVLTLQHEVDYAYWLLGEFRRIRSFVKKTGDLKINVEDVASVIIETASGCLIELHVDYLQRPPKRSLHIQGSRGSIDYCVGDRFLRFYDFKRQGFRELLDLKGYDANQMYREEMRNFIRGIAGKEKPGSTINDGIYVLKACLEIKKGLIA